MTHPNQGIIDSFFEAYNQHDFNGIKKVMDHNVTWFFLGQHPLAGIKKGIGEVVAFFDIMGEIMKQSNVKTDKLIVSANDNYVIECIHSRTDREDGNNLDHYACVLWTIKNEKIIEGRHFFADPQSVNHYFTSVTSKEYASH